MTSDEPVKTVAVTGGTGFIGRALVAALIQSGRHVRALTRREPSSELFRSNDVTIVRGGLESPDALAELVTGADAVVHCAGLTKAARYSDFERTNVAGVRALLSALGDTSTPLLALSSLAASRPDLSGYAQSKAAMEGVLGESIARSAAILRPPPVYGPGDRQLAPLFAALAWGVAPLPVKASARVSLLYVDDLASAVVAWLRGGATVTGTYALHDGTEGGYSWGEVVDTIARTRGRRVRRVPVSARFLDTAAWLNQTLGRRLGFAPMLTPGKLRELRHPDWVCDNDAWCRQVDWQPEVDLAEGFNRLRGYR